MIAFQYSKRLVAGSAVGWAEEKKHWCCYKEKSACDPWNCEVGSRSGFWIHLRTGKAFRKTEDFNSPVTSRNPTKKRSLNRFDQSGSRSDGSLGR